MSGVILLLLVVWVAGCASPAHRINRNPELFASFPAEVQELISKGQIDIGFTGPMVEMALGRPDRIYARQTAEGALEVWSYIDTVTTTDRQRVNTSFRVRDGSGSSRTVNDWVWVDVPRVTEHDRIRIEFVDGAAAAIDTLQR